MTRFLSAFFAVLTAFCLFVPVIQAADGATVTVSASQSTVNIGEEVKITVNLKNAGRISSIAFLVQYDREVFTLISSETPKKTLDYFYDSDGDGKSDGVTCIAVPLDEYGTCGLLLMPREKSASHDWFMSSIDDLDVITFQLKAKKTASAASVSVSVISLISANADASQNAEIPVQPIPDTVLSIVCEHRFGAWENADAQKHKQTCSVCGESVSAVHQWDEGEETKAPTCKEIGVKTYTCEVCSSTKTENIDKTDLHKWDEGKIVLSPTCKDEGKKDYLCQVCGETKTESIARTEVHSWDDLKVIEQPTCSESGIVLYTCSVCNMSQTAILAATDDCNYGLFYEYDQMFHWYECLSCHAKKNVQMHIWDEGTLVVSPTHTAVGKKKHTCIVCGMVKREILPLLAEHSYTAWQPHDYLLHSHICECGDIQYEGHHFDIWTVVKEASEEEAGIEKSICTDCGFVFERLIESMEEGSSAAWQTSAPVSVQQQTETTASFVTEPQGTSFLPEISIVVIAAIILAAGAVIAVIVIKRKKA